MKPSPFISRISIFAWIVAMCVPGLSYGQAVAPAVKPIVVADALDAKAGATKPAPDSVLFDGPSGYGNDVSKGILLKAKATPGAGSTWEFTYRRYGYHMPVQIFHPFENGQVVIQFTRDVVGISQPKQWIEIGYRCMDQVDTNLVNRTEFFEEVFPLLETNEYHVVSRLSADGSYEMLIDGKSVATGRVQFANPISLENPENKPYLLRGTGSREFQGPGLPLQWSAGWTALLAGPPTAAGGHVCRSIRYYPDFTMPPVRTGLSKPRAKIARPPLAPEQRQAPLPTATPDAKGNLLLNGSFENGTENWSLITTGKLATATVDPNEKHEGRPSLRIECQVDPVGAFVFQVLNLKASTRYRLSAWVKTKDIVKGEGQFEGVGAGLNGNDVRSRLVDTGQWTQVSTTFSTTATQPRASVRLMFGDIFRWIKGTAWFADVSLVEDAMAPAPGIAVARPPTANPATPAPATPVPAVFNADASELVSKHRSNLVFVTMPDGAGSGFIADYANGTYLFTNAHVAAGAKGAVFKTLEGTQVQVGAPAAAIGHDIFLMALKRGGTPLQLMTKVDETARIGDEIVVLGNAEGAGVINTITGKIVGLGPNLVEVDAPFQPGNSGSPIIHLKTGTVVGVATYLTIRKYDAATKSAIKEPVVRRFGYRLDSVKKWEPVNWQAFNAQAANLESIEKLTKDLIGFLRDLGEDGKVTRSAHTNPLISRRIDQWLEAKRKGLSARDSSAADQSFLSFLKSTCQADIIASQQRTTYDYFLRQIADQQKERAEIAGVFEKILADIRQ